MPENLPPLSALVLGKLEQIFAADDRDDAARLILRITGMGPRPITSARADRCRLAALKLSGGHLGRLRGALREFETDPRDLLMAAGFGQDLEAHLQWARDAD